MSHKGDKRFQAATEDNVMHTLNAKVADVDVPLMSVSQVVLARHEVVFSPSRSYISIKGGKYAPSRKLPLRLDGNVYRLKMWVPKDQPASFQGPARKSP